MAENRINRELETREKTVQKRLGSDPKHYLHPRQSQGMRTVGYEQALKVKSMLLTFPQNYVRVGNQ